MVMGNAFSSWEWVSPMNVIPARTAQKPLLPILHASIVAGQKCPHSCFLAKAVVLSPVYTAATWQ
jgi:hypothetical protein